MITTDRIQWNVGKVLKVEERFVERCTSGVGKDAVMEDISIGWFVVLDGGLSLGFGKWKPDCQPGENVLVEFRRDEKVVPLSR